MYVNPFPEENRAGSDVSIGYMIDEPDELHKIPIIALVHKTKKEAEEMYRDWEMD